MKHPIQMLAGMALAIVTATSLAEDPMTGCKCEMMKKQVPATTADAKPSGSKAELNELVTEMNSNIGPKKLEAMAALLTRLVQQANAQPSAAQPGVPAEAERSEAHHH